MAEDTIYTGFYTRLTGSTGVAALVGTRVRPFGVLKQNETLPAVAIFRVAGRRFPGYGSDAGHVSAVVQVDVYGRTQDEALDVAEEVRKALRNHSAGAIRGTFLETERDWYEEVSQSWRVLQQWNVHHSE